MSAPAKKAIAAPSTPDPYDDEDAWAVLDELEGRAEPSLNGRNGGAVEPVSVRRPRWLPEGMDPVLEELPKWSLLADVLQEIEEEMIRLESRLTSRKYWLRCHAYTHVY